MLPSDDRAAIPESRRREIFLALVTAQDGAMSVAESRRRVAEQFELSEGHVRQIEREGLDHGWPPL